MHPTHKLNPKLPGSLKLHPAGKDCITPLSVLHPSIFVVIERFPEYRDIIRQLYSSNKPFQSLCQNYQQCRDALRHWKASRDETAPERQREYMTLTDELELEILLYCMCDFDTNYEVWALD